MLNDETVGVLEDFLVRIKDKNMGEQLSILSEFRNKMPFKNYTKEEKNTIIEEALSNMENKDRNKYKTFLKVMQVL